SVCRQKSQNQLWCGSCHDVHGKERPAQNAGFYRSRCLNCHARIACSRMPEPASEAHRADDCIACHMPKRPVIESAHVTFTDHRIQRRPTADHTSRSLGTRLKLILPAGMDDPVVATRDLGFAYADLASSTGRAEYQRKAVQTLQPLVGTVIADAMFWQNLGEGRLVSGEIE